MVLGRTQIQRLKGENLKFCTPGSVIFKAVLGINKIFASIELFYQKGANMSPGSISAFAQWKASVRMAEVNGIREPVDHGTLATDVNIHSYRHYLVTNTYVI